MKINKFFVSMTTVISIMTLLSCSTNSTREVAQSKPVQKDSPKTGSELNIDWMTCLGTQVGADKKKVNSNSAFVVLKLGSYLTQKDISSLSDEPYAHTLRIREDLAPTQDEAKKLLQPEQKKYSSYDSADYDSPLVFNESGHIVDGDRSNYGPIDLEITGSSNEVTTFKGTYGSVENKYGYGYYNVTCEGKLIEKPTRVIDTTNVCRRTAKETILALLKSKNLNCTATARADYKHNKMNTFFVSTRCDDRKGYSYTVDTKFNEDGLTCQIKSTVKTGTRNLHK